MKKQMILISLLLAVTTAASARGRLPKERSHTDQPRQERNEVDPRSEDNEDSYTDSIYEDRDSHADSEGPHFNEPADDGEGGWDSEP